MAIENTSFADDFPITSLISRRLFVGTFDCWRLMFNPTSAFTSSAAQGGGGSFKNRTPIGEVDCCESRMAERIH